MVVPLAEAHILPQGSGVGVNKLKSGSIVETYFIGNTTINIVDSAYREKTPEQIQKSIDHFYAVGMEIARSIYISNPDSELFK